MQQYNSLSERINAWRKTNDERIVKQAGGKAYKYYISLLMILLCTILIYVFIVGIDHVIDEGMGLLSVCVSIFCLLAIAISQRKQAKRILKKRGHEAEKNDKAV